MSGQERQKALSIRELPRSDRPRERLIDLGAQALSSAELLAILLGSGGSGRTAIQLGQNMLAGAGGSLRRMAMQPVASLTALAGVGAARAAAVHAALELGRRMACETRDDGAPVRSPRDVVELFAARLQDLPVEEFHVAVLDSQHRLERDIMSPEAYSIRRSYIHARYSARQSPSGRRPSFWCTIIRAEIRRHQRTTVW